jgi:hypothetical protein
MRLIFLLCFCFLFLTCRNSTDAVENTAATQAQNTTPPSEKVNDKLRAEYKEYALKRSDWFPSKVVYEKGKLNPVDEARGDTAFFVFREKLLQAIANKDAFYLLEITSEKVNYSFGASDGVAGFVQHWGLDSPDGIESSTLWETLEKVLKEGGTFSEGRHRFTAPYYFSGFPDEYDAFTYAAIIGKGVRMRERAGLKTKVVKSLSYDIVEILEYTNKMEKIGEDEFPWVHIKLLDGREGFMWGKFIGSAIGYRAGFVKQQDGRWLMEFFVAGD